MPSSKRVRTGLFIWVGALLCLLANARPALAETPQQTQQALLKAQGLLKQIAQQKSLAEAELAKLRGELAGKEKALAKIERMAETQKISLTQAEVSLSAASQRSTALTGNLERTKARLEQTTDKLREVAGMYKATRAKLQATEAARQTVEAQLASTTTALQDAEKKNLALYALNRELSAQYADKSVWDTLRQREPFTGIGQVATENQAQDIEDRNYEQLREINVEAADK
jgi:chromosome segregation ATPase